MISVVQASAWYPPKYMGGTEVYVTALTRELRALGIYTRVVASCEPGEEGSYEFDGTVVRTYAVASVSWRAKLRGEDPPQNVEQFRRVLLSERAAVYHQHSWDVALGASHLRAAREAGFRTVLTVHTPWNLCLRGTMVRFGREACDGRIDPPVCGACWIEKHGVPPTIGRSIAAVPPWASRLFGSAIPEQHLASVLSARAVGERRKREFVEMMANADRVVAICAWLFDALRLNGAPAEKLVLNRSGVDPAFAEQVADALKQRESGCEQPFRLLYLGRWDPTKGIDVVVRAVRVLPREAPITLSIHGIGEGAEQRKYATAVRYLAGDDPRIRFEPPLPRARVLAAFLGADALVVPSLWLETGPLVVLEAKAAGLPVIGSRLGGIAELVREPEDGVLVPPGNVAAWAETIVSMITHRSQRKSEAKTEVRTMRDVAREMVALYESIGH